MTASLSSANVCQDLVSVAIVPFSRSAVVQLSALWQLSAMIEFLTLADDHPDLGYSPLLRGALLTLKFAREHGSIGLTKTKAFKRVFVHWAVENFDWPGKSAEEMFR